MLGSRHGCSTVYDGFNRDRQLRQDGKEEGCFQAHVEATTSSRTILGCHVIVAWLLVADHDGWCCLAMISAVWGNVRTTTLEATTMATWDNLACNRSRWGAQHGWVLLVWYNVGRWRKRLSLIFWLGSGGFARGQSNEVLSAWGGDSAALFEALGAGHLC
jgi:uncharacterized protein with GYD domain